jgi:tRNA1(Val) A37 N6-methylase TrmN6
MTTTDDRFLGGALRVRQPARGYRAGLDAVLLAATVPAPVDAASRVLDLGAGVGTVGLAIAVRAPQVEVTLVEREPDLVLLARANSAANGVDGRVRVIEADVTADAASLADAGVRPDSFDHAVANPPYFSTGFGLRPTLDQRATSREMPEDDLEVWIKCAARAVRPGGTLTLIHRPEALGRLLAALEGRFGGLMLRALSAGELEPATRILVHGRKGSRAPLRLLAPLVTHTANGSYTAPVDALISQPAHLPWPG